jgi:Do/DeqQ family serine protease
LLFIVFSAQSQAFAFKFFGKDDGKEQKEQKEQEGNSSAGSESNSEQDNAAKSGHTNVLNNNSNNSARSVASNMVLGKISFADAVARAEPAVISIQTTQELPNELHPLLQDPFFKFFFNDPNMRNHGRGQNNTDLPKQTQQGIGSGVIVNKKGYVLTNYHVIKDAKSISIKLPDGRTSDAKVIGSDSKTDLAVLKVEGLKDLPEIPLGSSENVKVGDVVLAIGNPLGFSRTVTLGIVSATGSVQQRLANNGQIEGFGPMLDNLIQTDASINPGNSGGALLDSQGNLIGINMAIISSKNDSSNIGIGFAIPIDLAKDIMQQLIETGHIIRGWLGAYLGELSEEVNKYLGYKEKYGVHVRGIFRNSPAQKAGLLPGDIIVKINGKQVQNADAAAKIVFSLSPNKGYPFEIFRKGEFITFDVVITERPKDYE